MLIIIMKSTGVSLSKKRCSECLKECGIHVTETYHRHYVLELSRICTTTLYEFKIMGILPSAFRSWDDLEVDSTPASFPTEVVAADAPPFVV